MSIEAGEPSGLMRWINLLHAVQFYNVGVADRQIHSVTEIGGYVVTDPGIAVRFCAGISLLVGKTTREYSTATRPGALRSRLSGVLGCVSLGYVFEDASSAHSTSDTHGDQSVAAVTAFEFTDEAF